MIFASPGMWEALGGFGVMLLIVAPFLYLAFKEWMKEGPNCCAGCGHTAEQHTERKWYCLVVACECHCFKEKE